MSFLEPLYNFENTSFHENEAEYGSAKIIRIFTENESSITIVLEEPRYF